MKTKLITVFVVLAIVLGSFALPQSAQALADTTKYITTINYQNIGSAATTFVKVYFYKSATDTNPIIIDSPNLPRFASTTLFIGDLTLTGFEKGSAILNSDQPMASVLAQIPQNSTTVKNRPVSNGFAAGTQNSFIATVIKNTFDQKTVFAVQNAGTADANINIKFFLPGNPNPVYNLPQLLKPGAGYFVDATSISQLGASFSGSAVVEGGAGASIVSSAMELGLGTSVLSRSFEGVGSGSKIVYMPSALCNYGFATSNYAIQNTSLTQSTSVTVTYSSGLGETKNVAPGAKESFNGCVGKPAGAKEFIGSATITSTVTDIIATGKVAGGGRTTAFMGFSEGYQKIALPLIRWATNANYNVGKMERTNIAIQNIGGGTIPGGSITVKYIDRNGAIVGTHIIPDTLVSGAKANSSPNAAGLVEFGCYSSCTQFGGGAIIEGPSGSQLAVIVRVAIIVPARGNETAAEDYNGIEIP